MYHLSSEYFTWDNAVKYCQARDMNLASVHDTDECESKTIKTALFSQAIFIRERNHEIRWLCIMQAKLSHQSSTKYPSECRWFWLGGSRISTNDTWKWIDGTKNYFTPSFFEVNNTAKLKSGIAGWLKSPSNGCYGKGPGWQDLYVAIEILNSKFSPWFHFLLEIFLWKTKFR